MKPIRFTIPIEPRAQRRARARIVGSHAGVYKDPKQLRDENQLFAMILDHRPEKPLEGPLSLGVKAYLPIPKSKPKKFREAAAIGFIAPTTKPDLDNLIKMVKDVMSGVFYADDKQIVSYLPGTGKYYSELPRWELELRPWDPIAF